IDVHQHDLRTILWQSFQRVLGVGVIADARKAFSAVQDACKGAAKFVAVFHNGNGDGHVAQFFLMGALRRTTAPCFAAGPIEKLPPTSSIRLRMLCKPFLPVFSSSPFRPFPSSSISRTK